MTAVEYIIAWIESRRPHYDRLLAIHKFRTDIQFKNMNASIANQCFCLARDAYHEMVSVGEARAKEHSPETILQAAIALTQWEIE